MYLNNTQKLFHQWLNTEYQSSGKILNRIVIILKHQSSITESKEG